MKEDLSLIKRYPIVEYLERKGFKPVRRIPAYAMFRSPLREEMHPSFKVDTEKNLWIDYAEGCGGSIIDLCMRMERCSLSEAIRLLGRNAPDTAYNSHKESAQGTIMQECGGQAASANGARRLISVSDTLPPRLQRYLSEERCIDMEKAKPFIRCASYEVRGRNYQVIGFANQSGGYELRDNGSFKGTVAPKDITPMFTDGAQPVCVFEGFMDFLSFFSMKEEVTNHCLVMNSVNNVARSIHYLHDANVSSIRAFLDNDEAGRRATKEFAVAGFNVEDMSVHYRDFKDLNEYHVHRVHEIQKRQSQEIPHRKDSLTKTIRQVKRKMR